MTHLDLFLTFLRLGCTCFGGPVAHLGYFREEFVARKQWLSEIEYANLIALCQFIPGPASSQVGAAIGYRQAGYSGALLAWIGFTLPSALLMFSAATYLLSAQNPELIAYLHGLKLVAVAIVAQAVWGMQKQLCATTATRVIALFAVALLLTIPWQFMQLVVIGGGIIAGLLITESSNSIRATHSSATPSTATASNTTLVLALLGAFLLGLVALPFWVAEPSGLISLFDKFYRAGALVFGGGHVVLPLLFDELVPAGIVTETDFLIGYGAAQALPGPLFTFATFLGAATTENNAIVSGIVATVAIFLPGMLLLFAVLPFWHKVNQNTQVKRCLVGVNAAVVGLLLAALIDPIVTSTISTLSDIIIVVVAFAALTRFKIHPLWVIAGCLVSHGLVMMITSLS